MLLVELMVAAAPLATLSANANANATCGGELRSPATAGVTRSRDGFDLAFAPARARAVGELEGYAEWCAGVRLAADRELALAAILHLDPAHEGAHRGLKHVKQRDGSWAPPAKKAETKNANKPLESQSLERRGAIATALLDAGAQLARTSEPSDAREQRRRLGLVVAAVLAIEPNHEAARRAGGEARRDDAWVLLETLAARAQRAELEQRVDGLVAGVPDPLQTPVRAHEEALGIAWTHAVSTPRVRVLTDGAASEAEKAAVMCHAAIELLCSLAQVTTDLSGDYSVYLLTSATSRDAFVSAWPGWSDAQRAQVKTWAGCGVPGDVHQARWDKDAAHRLDGAVRHTLGLLMLRELKFDHQHVAWAWEGLGLYLTRELVGTRFTWYSTAPASGDNESKDLLGRLLLSDVNWVNEFYQRAKRGRAPKLDKLCSTRIDAFGVDDMLASYSLAAYLLEGRAADLPELLRALGGGAAGGADALSELFDGDLAAGDSRLLRWLSERK